MAISYIKANLDKLDVSYPPCLDKTSPIGFTEIKIGVDPLPESFWLIIKLNISHSNEIPENILDTIEELLENITEEDDVKRIGDRDMFAELLNKHEKLQSVLSDKWSILRTYNNITHDTIGKLNDIISIVKEIRDLNDNIRLCTPGIMVYCHSGMKIHKMIGDDLYDYIKK